MKIYLVNTAQETSKYDILYNTLYNMFRATNELEIIDELDCADCIISAGDISSQIIKRKQSSQVAIIRFLYRSDVSKHFYTDETLVDYTFWVNDLDINILYPYLQTSTKIEIPFDFHQNDEASNKDNKYDIYVNTGEFLYADSALFKILRTLNRLTQYKIDICSKNTNLRNILNSNITLSDSTNSIEQHVKECRMVIGSGYAILYAIKYNKPFIVIGERGYGGIPTETNILQYYQDFFQGTIGGRLDGALPENLVYEDILNISSKGQVCSYEFAEILSTANKGTEKNIIAKITEITKYIQTVNVSSLKFNTDYTIIQGNGIYWLLNRFTRFIIKKIEPEEVKIINEYIAPNVEPNLMNNINSTKIKELQHMKILI